jgi:hypothetical protein
MRYFFDVAGSGISTRDIEGTELPTREDAAAEAAKIAAEIAFHHLKGASEAGLVLQVAVREGQKVLLRSRLTIGLEEGA